MFFLSIIRILSRGIKHSVPALRAIPSVSSLQIIRLLSEIRRARTSSETVEDGLEGQKIAPAATQPKKTAGAKKLLDDIQVT